MASDTERRAVDLDERDLALLRCIEADFDMSLEELADQLDLSKSTVHYRLKKLREKGVVTGVSADLDPLAFGLDMVMITEVSVDHESGYADDIGARLTEVPGVTQVYYTMGDVDFVAISRTQDRDQMNEVLDAIVSIDGVDETSSRFVMKELQTGDRVLSNLSEQTREDVLDRQ